MSPLATERFVLLVEDDLLIVEVFERVFAQHPEFLLDVSTNIPDAIHKVEVITYDVVFLDMKFGDDFYAGMKVLREINRIAIKARAEGRAVLNGLVVIMSASVNLHDVMHEANDLGVLCFMAKPVSFTDEYMTRILNRIGLPILPPRTREEDHSPGG